MYSSPINEEDIAMFRVHRLLVFASALLISTSILAEQLDANGILAKQKAGVSAEALVAMINDPANTISVKSEDLAALQSGGVPESVLAALRQKVAAPATTATQPSAAAQPRAVPDDSRLLDVVKIVRSGISESLIAEQIKQSGLSYKLTMNDLLYLKQNDVQDSVISALLATKQQEEKKAEAPAETTFNGLLLVRGWGPLRKERPGRLIRKGDAFSWIDGSNPKENFEFQVAGLEKIWYTCQSQTAGDVCYQINVQVVQGPRYSFVDISRASGSNEVVKSLMETLRKDYPRAPFGAPDH